MAGGGGQLILGDLGGGGDGGGGDGGGGDGVGGGGEEPQGLPQGQLPHLF